MGGGHVLKIDFVWG